jgi:mannose-6-phosphate isomerase-like protein (cupin superfamily)
MEADGMGDSEMIEELDRRFHAMPAEVSNIRVHDLPFTDAAGRPFGPVKHLVAGDDKSGAHFDIYRFGWFGGRVWELVIIDGAYLPHAHQKIDSEFFILAGRGHVSRDDEWDAYRERSRVAVDRGVAHGFITDPEFGATAFLSIQSEPIRKIVIDPVTKSEKFEDDFVYADDSFPLPPDLVQQRKQKLTRFSR